VLIDESLVEGVKEKSELFVQRLKHPLIKAVRAEGLLISVEFESFEVNKKLIDFCIENGLLTDWFLFAPHCMRIAPPLTISKKEIKSACAIVLKALRMSEL
jgi:acetylornithine/succinyldiaminopimelate/putrescine aminotransferase